MISRLFYFDVAKCHLIKLLILWTSVVDWAIGLSTMQVQKRILDPQKHP